MRINCVHYSPHFKRSFKKLSRPVQLEYLVREKWFRKDPFDSRLKTHRLSGNLKGLLSFSLSRSHRVLFFFITDTEVGFYDVGDHTIYR